MVLNNRWIVVVVLSVVLIFLIVILLISPRRWRVVLTSLRRLLMQVVMNLLLILLLHIVMVPKDNLTELLNTWLRCLLTELVGRAASGSSLSLRWLLVIQGAVLLQILFIGCCASASSSPSGRHVILSFVQSGILLFENMQQSLRRLEDLHECLLCLLNRPVKLLLRFIFLNEGLS